MMSYVCLLVVWNYSIDQDIIQDVLGVFTSLEEAVAYCKSHEDFNKSNMWLDIVEFTGSVRGKEITVESGTALPLPSRPGGP